MNNTLIQDLVLLGVWSLLLLIAFVWYYIQYRKLMTKCDVLMEKYVALRDYLQDELKKKGEQKNG